jgi:hypothetical protein
LLIPFYKEVTIILIPHEVGALSPDLSLPKSCHAPIAEYPALTHVEAHLVPQC